MIGRFVIMINARIGANFVHSFDVFDVISVVSKMLIGKYRIRNSFFGMPEVIGAICNLWKKTQSNPRRKNKKFPLIKSINA